MTDYVRVLSPLTDVLFCNRTNHLMGVCSKNLKFEFSNISRPIRFRIKFHIRTTFDKIIKAILLILFEKIV